MSSQQAEEPVRRRTGGRSARVREAVLQATLEALTEHGPSGLTFSEIARRSGVHATSIQRRWGSLENLLLDSVLTYSQARLPIPDTGSLRGDFIAFARSMTDYLATPMGATVVRTTVVAEDDSTVAANRARVIEARYEATRAMVDRAADRGELRSGVDPAIALELLVGGLFYRCLVARYPTDDEHIEQLVDTLVRGLAK